MTDGRASGSGTDADGEGFRLAEAFAQLSLEAAVAIMEVYSTQGCSYRTKDDASPVSEADEQAELIIVKGLGRCAPGVPILAEEAAARGIRPAVDGRFILVDPLDGTKEFIGGNGEFTVNIALIEAGQPTVGVVYAPILGRLWMAAGKRAEVCHVRPGQTLAEATERTRVHCRAVDPDAFVAMASRSHGDPETDRFLSGLPVSERRQAGSSLKFCVIAEGRADVYPRFGPTMEWDTAAGDAVLRAAGGSVLSVSGGPLAYGKTGADYRNGGFVAWGDQAAAARWHGTAASPVPAAPRD